VKNNLTKREKEILALVLREHTSYEISRALDLSVQTINTHRKNILRKTASKTMIGLVKFSIKADLVENFYYKNKSVRKTKTIPR